MKRISAEKISDWLIVVLILLLCLDVFVTLLTPALAYFHSSDPASISFESLMAIFAYDFDDGMGNLLGIILSRAWQQPGTAMLSGFLLVCGICAAVILIQGIRILATIADGSPFSSRNASSLKWAAACCFIIAAAALIRTISTVFLKNSMSALLSYTALFIPLFIMAGLLFLIMSGLFGQATAMKAENDLTI